MVFQNNLLMGAGGQAAEAHEIDESCRFNDDDTAYLTITPSGASNRKTWTLSTWVKRSYINQSDDEDTGSKHIWCAGTGNEDRLTTADQAVATTGENILCFNFAGTNGTLKTSQVFRDPAAWFHVVVAVDTTQGVAANRVKMYVNGAQVTDFSATSYPSQDTEGQTNNNVIQRIGSRTSDTNGLFDGYLAETCLIDGLALDPSSFGETNSTTGQWVPIDVSGLTFGTNGFLMAFQDSSALGDDTSGNGNDFASSGLAAADQMTDSPTDNFCTLNSIDKATQVTLADGNLQQ